MTRFGRKVHKPAHAAPWRLSANTRRQSRPLPSSNTPARWPHPFGGGTVVLRPLHRAGYPLSSPMKPGRHYRRFFEPAGACFRCLRCDSRAVARRTRPPGQVFLFSTLACLGGPLAAVQCEATCGPRPSQDPALAKFSTWSASCWRDLPVGSDADIQRPALVSSDRHAGGIKLFRREGQAPLVQARTVALERHGGEIVTQSGLAGRVLLEQGPRLWASSWPWRTIRAKRVISNATRWGTPFGSLV